MIKLYATILFYLLSIPTIGVANNVLIGDEVRSYFQFDRSVRSWSIGGPKTWPESFWREAQFTRNQSINCTRAVHMLILRESAIKHKTTIPLPPKTVVLKDYVESCLTPIETVSDEEGGYKGTSPSNSKFLIQLVGTNNLKLLRHSIVSIPGIVGKPCSGMVIQLRNNTTKRGILTAAHCLGSISKNAKERLKSRSLDISQKVTFDDISGERHTVALIPHNRKTSYDPVNEDIALILLDNTFLEGVRGLPISSGIMNSFEHIYIVGQNELLREYRNFLSNNDTLAANLPKLNTTITLGALCRAHGQIGSLLLHNCQTRWGSSGATMIIVINRMPYVIGVHTGSRFNSLQGYFNNENGSEILKNSVARNYGILLGVERN